ncbi:MAG: YqgE/AlgH family protein [bacterium]
MKDQDFLTGQLLIAMPNLKEGCFKESVVLICTHDKHHAMGVIINKPISNLNLKDVLEQIGIEPVENMVAPKVLFGGPVETKRGLVLHSLDYNSEQTLEIDGQIGLTATRKILSELNISKDQASSPPLAAQLLMGHAGWTAGQLEHEIMQNAWLHCPMDLELIFDTPLEDIWPQALAKLGMDRTMFSKMWAEVRDLDTPLN